jgi:hypothetical protein
MRTLNVYGQPITVDEHGIVRELDKPDIILLELEPEQHQLSDDELIGELRGILQYDYQDNSN